MLVVCALGAGIAQGFGRFSYPVLLPSRLPSEQATLYPSGGRSRGGYDDLW